MMRTQPKEPVRAGKRVRGRSGIVHGATYGNMTLAVEDRSTESLYGQSKGAITRSPISSFGSCGWEGSSRGTPSTTFQLCVSLFSLTDRPLGQRSRLLGASQTGFVAPYQSSDSSIHNLIIATRCILFSTILLRTALPPELSTTPQWCSPAASALCRSQHGLQ
jgi:hypothetical protein